jgi:hypothetical protein
MGVGKVVGKRGREGGQVAEGGGVEKVSMSSSRGGDDDSTSHWGFSNLRTWWSWGAEKTLGSGRQGGKKVLRRG